MKAPEKKVDGSGWPPASRWCKTPNYCCATSCCQSGKGGWRSMDLSHLKIFKSWGGGCSLINSNRLLLFTFDDFGHWWFARPTWELYFSNGTIPHRPLSSSAVTLTFETWHNSTLRGVRNRPFVELINYWIGQTLRFCSLADNHKNVRELAVWLPKQNTTVQKCEDCVKLD